MVTPSNYDYTVKFLLQILTSTHNIQFNMSHSPT